MTCHICDRAMVFHGSERVVPCETGCHDGVLMDDDEYFEGWQADVVYPPCPFNPSRRPDCGGSGNAPPDHEDSDDCPACGGSGWKGNEPQWPTAAVPPDILAELRGYIAEARRDDGDRWAESEITVPAGLLEALLDRLEAAEAALTKPPHAAVRGAVPIVLYFTSRADADEFIQAVREAKPGMIAQAVAP